MYNDNCKQEGCSVPVPVDSMKNVMLEIHDQAMKARQMAFDIYKKLFGAIPCDVGADKDSAVGCAFNALLDINGIEKDTLEVLCAVIERIGE